MSLEQPAGEISARIRAELNETEDTRNVALQHIKEWLEKQPHLPDTWSEISIITFLRGCKFSLEKCKRKLDMYFSMRTALPEFFADRDIARPVLQKVMNLVQVLPLRGLTPEGHRMTILRGVNKDVITPNVAESFKLIFMIGDVRLSEETVGVAREIYILDALCVTPQHFAKFTPSLVKKFLVCVQEAYPIRLKQVHIINTSPMVDTVFKFVKPFLKEKMRNRIFIHNDLNDIYKMVPREMLPEEYGGNAGSIVDLNNTWHAKLERYGLWFKEQESIKADESKRPVKTTNFEELFGIDGSFRQLVID